MRIVGLALLFTLALGCHQADQQPAASTAQPAQAPNDAQHQGIMGPHGDHTPKHGGMVLMYGDVHYEVVLAKTGRHEVWFTDAMRNELPASVASTVTMEVTRPDGPVETVQLAINDTGEAWVANARPVEDTEGVMVKVRYALRGEQPQEIELPFVASNAP